LRVLAHFETANLYKICPYPTAGQAKVRVSRQYLNDLDGL
jgi:hypothetical protein